ncbi:MAG: adenosine deaminase [Anaerolineae bacterium]
MNQAQDLVQWAQSLPKIDLHRHLEGSLRLRTLADIAVEHGIDLPSYDIEQLRPYVQFTDDAPNYRGFLEKFKLLRRFYTSKEAVKRVTREAILDAAQDNVRYLELRFNPVALARTQGFPLHEVVGWVQEATAETQAECDTRVCLILTINRAEADLAEEIVDLAIAYFGPFVRGVDLAGDETRYPFSLFKEPLRRARAAGLGLTVHAGEATGAESVRVAVEILQAQRIGHGVQAIENSEVISLLYERNITLEVCPTSNFQTGVIPHLSLHPLLDLFGLRLSVTINTDDPSVSDTTLSDEYLVAVEAVGLKKRMIYQAIWNAVEAAFLPEEERPALRTCFRRELAFYPEAGAVIPS